MAKRDPSFHSEVKRGVTSALVYRPILLARIRKSYSQAINTINGSTVVEPLLDSIRTYTRSLSHDLNLQVKTLPDGSTAHIMSDLGSCSGNVSRATHKAHNALTNQMGSIATRTIENKAQGILDSGARLAWKAFKGCRVDAKRSIRDHASETSKRSLKSQGMTLAPCMVRANPNGSFGLTSQIDPMYQGIICPSCRAYLDIGQGDCSCGQPITSRLASAKESRARKIGPHDLGSIAIDKGLPVPAQLESPTLAGGQHRNMARESARSLIDGGSRHAWGGRGVSPTMKPPSTTLGGKRKRKRGKRGGKRTT